MTLRTTVRKHAAVSRRKLNVALVLIGIGVLLLEIVYLHHYLHHFALSVDLGDWSPLLYVEGDPNTQQKLATWSSSSTSSAPPLSQPNQRTPDGTFNGYPIYHHDLSSTTTTTTPLPSSQIHCIGETNAEPLRWRRKNTHVDMNWATRSCHFQFFCLDLDRHEFVLYLDKEAEEEKQNTRGDVSKVEGWETQQTVFTNRSAEGHPYTISIGGVNGKWNYEGYPKLQWFPRIEYRSPPTNFYALPANVTWIPFHSLAAFNPGHLVWDDFLPLYTLLQIFDRHDVKHHDVLLTRYRIPGEGLWAGCDWRNVRSQECNFMLKKFGPLMIRHRPAIPMTTQHDFNLTLTSSSSTKKSNLVCAKHGLAGLGALTDHGIMKGHGWEQKDYASVYNHGRGGQLWRFRNFMMTNVGVTPTLAPPAPPYRIIFSERSSKMGHRSMDFTGHIQFLKDSGLVDDGDVELESHQMKQFSMKEQVELVSGAAMYVTGCGGGAVTATFLPRGSTTIVYYSEIGGIENNKASGKPARLDWDYFNNMAYSRVHWMTQPHYGFKGKEGMQGFLTLVQHDLNLMRQQHAEYDAMSSTSL